MPTHPEAAAPERPTSAARDLIEWRRRGRLLIRDLSIFWTVVAIVWYLLHRFVTIQPKEERLAELFIAVVAYAVVGRLVPPIEKWPRLSVLAVAVWLVSLIIAVASAPPGVHWRIVVFVVPLSLIFNLIPMAIGGALSHRL